VIVNESVFLGPATKLPANDPNDRQEILIKKKILGRAVGCWVAAIGAVEFKSTLRMEFMWSVARRASEALCGV